MSATSQLNQLKKDLPETARLVAVSKFHPAEAIREAYEAGQRLFGENRVQELVAKHEQLPAGIEWHFIGHLQANKVKYIASFVAMIQSIDSVNLLKEVQKEAAKNQRIIPVLLQIHIAQEEHKFGFSFAEAETFLQTAFRENFPNVQFRGLMGMATFTDDQEQIRKEFRSLAGFFYSVKNRFFANDPDFNELSMGMSDDYLLAIEEGSTLVRIGTKLFGAREYKNNVNTIK
jgi:pyridoxal phosphate enzyme (YggS family)